MANAVDGHAVPVLHPTSVPNALLVMRMPVLQNDAPADAQLTTALVAPMVKSGNAAGHRAADSRQPRSVPLTVSITGSGKLAVLVQSAAGDALNARAEQALNAAVGVATEFCFQNEKPQLLGHEVVAASAQPSSAVPAALRSGSEYDPPHAETAVGRH